MNTEANVEIIRKAYADFSRGDIPSILAMLDPDIEWITPGSPQLPMSGTHRGREGVGNFFTIVNETWEFTSFEPREYLAAGDQVIVKGQYDARSRRTGRTAKCDWVMVWRLRNGKAAEFREYTDTAALEKALAQASSTAG